jgi:hypothetical protein
LDGVDVKFTILLEPEELEQCVLVVEVWGWGGVHEGILSKKAQNRVVIVA